MAMAGEPLHVACPRDDPSRDDARLPDRHPARALGALAKTPVDALLADYLERTLEIQPGQTWTQSQAVKMGSGSPARKTGTSWWCSLRESSTAFWRDPPSPDPRSTRRTGRQTPPRHLPRQPRLLPPCCLRPSSECATLNPPSSD